MQEPRMEEGAKTAYRLSPQQTRLFLLQQDNDSPSYRAQSAILIEGNLDTKLLETAIQKVVDQNESLRTTFMRPTGLSVSVQVVAETATVVCSHISLNHVEQHLQKEQIDRLFKQEKQNPFDFRRSSLLRASLISLSADKHILLISLPALCADARTLDNILHKISLTYAACLTGEPLDASGVQYVQFSEWQNELIDDDQESEGNLFWRAWAPAPLTLSFTGTALAGATFAPESLARALDPQLVATVREVARQYGVSIDRFYLTCWQTLLWRLTGQSKISVGILFDGRKFEDLSDSLGLFAKWLPLSLELDSSFQFSQVLKETQQRASEAGDWQEYFIWNGGHENNRNGKVHAEIGFEYQPRVFERTVAGVRFSTYERYVCIDRFDLKLSCTEATDSLLAEFHYDPSVFAARDIERLANEFQVQLASAAHGPETAINKLRILDDAQRQQVLFEFNSTEVSYPQDQCLHHLFEQQVERTPDAVAMAYEGEQLTYSEVNRRANQLARHLRSLGVGPDTLVGICIDRSLDMVVGVLGTLKAGGAYLPLDPEYPKDRLRFMIEDARASVLLTHVHLAANLLDCADQLICIDSDWGLLAHQSAQNLAVEVAPDNLAYVIYTSGSTGKPKGAMNTHRGVCNRQLWMQQTYPLSASDHVMQLSSFSFDFSVWEILGTLSAGAKLVLVRPGEHKDTASLRRLIADERVTVVHYVPSLLQAFLDESGLEISNSLQRVLCGGEALPFELQERFFARSKAQLHNQYGPTETSIDVTFWDCRRDDDSNVVPIGRPNANNTIHLLDGEGEPAPIGVSSELHIGGVAVGRGYLNRPDLTAERFIPDPFTRIAGARLYRTGDLGRYRPDGNIEYQGRIDEQVKIRGFRIELGEVEAVFNSHPDVREAIVVSQKSPAGDNRLAAFVVCSQEHAVSPADLRNHAAQKLPDYMVPGQIVTVDFLPLTASGKVDRKALGSMQIAPDTNKAQRGPRNAVEEILIGIWKEVLGLEEVGVEDNVFDIGGHSLLATQIVSRVRVAFGIDLEIRSLFESPVLEDLAREIEQKMGAGEGLQAPAVTPAARQADFPLSFAQQRLWFIHQLEPGSSAYNLPVALRFRRRVNIAALGQALNEVFRRHESLRTVFKLGEGTPRQVIKSGGRIEIELADLRGLGESESQGRVRSLTSAEAGMGFDLSEGPLVRANLLLLEDEDYVLLLTIHHIVSDGWSMGILVKEVTALYDAYTTGGPSPLDELEVQYSDYSQWQRQWLTGDVLETQMRYWRQQLGDLGVLELPSDRTRPPVQTYIGSSVRIDIDVQVANKLRELSMREGATLFMVLLAGFKVLMHRYSGQEEIVVGTPIAGRNRTETEGLIGFFVNTLVVRTQVIAASTFSEVLASVREVMLGAYTHQDVPFEKLVEELQPERDLSRSPLFQVMFSFQTRPKGAEDLSKLDINAEPVATAISRLDLTMDLIDSGRGLFGALEYNSDLFDRRTVETIALCYRTLLSAIAEQPEQQVSLIPLLTSVEREEILGEWNRTEAAYPTSECIHELVEAQASRTPDQVAIVCAGQMLSYRELDRLANQLAHYLSVKGAGPEVKVGVCLDRGLEMVIALLAILKAGAAYVPLDPDYPPQRIALMMEDARMTSVVTQMGLESVLEGYEGEVVLIDQHWQQIRKCRQRRVESGVEAGNAAYVIYTSGSTGRPKGVIIEHRSVVNFLCSMREQPGLRDTDRLLAVTSVSFDIAALELFLPLITGAAIVIATRQTATDGELLLKELTESGATIMQATPATWRLLVETGWKNENSVKVLSGGEYLPPHLASDLLDRAPSLWNLYGPTETTIWSTVLNLTKDSAVITIGRPVANTQTYIVDDKLEPVPIRLAGHLLIGGDGLARGYHLGPDLTAEKFVPNPFSRSGGGRLYKTGDRAKHQPDGNIEFLGRNDQQVKIRGYRIEIGEIETTLGEHPEVRASLVLLFEESPGDKRLVAYVLPSSQRNLNSSGLRQFLKERLPEYMVPASFVMMEDFPRMPNGKIDRKALRAPERTKARFEESSDEPRTPLEKQLHQIWTDLLEVDQISIKDNFFELGGHSLLAMQVTHRLRRIVGVEVPVIVLFESPTIAEMAVMIARHRAEQEGTETGPVELRTIVPDPANRFLPFPLNDVQQAYWIGRGGSYQLGNVSSHSYTEFDFIGLDVDRLCNAVNRVIDRHDMLRAIISPDGLQQILAKVPPYQIMVHDVRHKPPEAVNSHLRSVREQMSHQVMATDRWPLFNIQASLLQDGRIRIHFGLDYLIADALSVTIIFEEMSRFYEDPNLKLPAIELSFRDCVLAEIAQEGSQSYQAAEQYWLDRVATLPPAPDLPLAVVPDSVTNPRFTRRSRMLSRDTWRQIKEIGLTYGLTPTGILLGAFAEVLATWSKSARFTINLTIFNRPPVHPEIMGIVADFTSLNLLEVDRSRPTSFGLGARAIQEQLWNDLDHRALNGIRVLREMARAQGGRSTPIMPVVFTSTLGQNNQASSPFASGLVRLDNNDQVYGITQTPQVWLDHQVAEVKGDLLFNWDAVEELFSPGALNDMWRSYNTLLDRLIDEGIWQQRFHQLLPETQVIQRKRVNATQAAIPQGLLQTAFEQHARQAPDRVAVIAPQRTLTYGELDRRATQLARRLRELGCQTNQLVAVVMHKGWEQIVATLAILKSGAAYVPIDASLPAERLLFLLDQSEVKVALTQPQLLDTLSWPQQITVLAIESEAPQAAVEALDPIQDPSDLAYVIFTSGSTGAPKGVMIDHRGALNTILDINERLRVTSADRVLALSSLSFDLSVYDIFGLLAAGGAVVLPQPDAGRDPAQWLELITRHRVTIWDSVPALMEMLAQYVEGLGVRPPATLRTVLLSGDWVPVSLPGRVKRLTNGAKVWSLGGATEASIWSIIYKIGEVGPDWVSIPYGKPMLNQSFRVLNERMQDCPVWVAGQLFIGGVGLAKGYWRDEQKTNASFITDAETGERLYRTGDMGRYLPDGNIEFLGREDTQVKVGGHRIELGEIEATLEQHPAVRAAVAVATGKDRFNKRLAAFVVLQEGLDNAGSTLSAFLRDKLPIYMVPGLITPIEELPLSPNGKVDRQRLAAMDLMAPSSAVENAQVEPRTPLEKKVAAIWSEALDIQNVSLSDSFFDLGGNSINAIRITTRLREAFGIDLPLREFFLAQSLSEVVARVEQLTEEKAQEKTASIQRYAITPDPEHRFEPFPLNDVQHAYWIGRNQFFELGNIAAHGYAEYDLHDVDMKRLNIAIQRLIARHDMLRAVTLPDGRQRILKDVPPYEIKVIDLHGQDAQAVARSSEATRTRMSHQMLPTSEWPLFEICAFVLDENRVRVHVSIDILITDAWSSRILSRDLAAFYDNPEVSLPPLELSFRDYVLAEIAFRDSDLYSRSLDYWREHLAEIHPAPILPTVRTAGLIQTPRFVRHAAALDKERWQRLKVRASEVHLTPSALLLAAFSEALYPWSKNSKFTINLTMFNRLPLHPQSDQIVGDFTSVILVPIDGQRVGTFESRARALQEQLWETMEHRFVGGISVLREIARSQKRAPHAITPVVFTSTLFDEPVGDHTSENGLRGKQVYGISQTPQVWLDHQVSELAGALHFNWDVVEELFPEGLFDDIFESYCQLLTALADSEEAWQAQRWSWLPSYQTELRLSVNATEGTIPQGLLQTAFEQHARQAPDRVAVIAPQRTLTYGELDRRATQLARRLRELGCQTNQLVAVVMHKGWEQIVATLAILKSGAAYVPIDASLPAERLLFLLDQSEVKVALTQPQLLDTLSWPQQITVLAIESEAPQAAVEALDPIQDPSDLAYVIFTSGSTGAPKGVMIDHRGALNTILDINERLRVTSADRVLALSSLSFDLSVYDIFGLLAAGGAVVLPQPDAGRDPAQWLELITRHRVTIWDSVPALMEMLAQYVEGLGVRPPATLRTVLLSGDWVPVSLPGRVKRLTNGAKVWSLGGATEASIWSIIYKIGEVGPDWVSIPYGKPMLNQSFRVLNERMQDCPVWVAGQLFIGGVGLAKGYWRDEQKTNASFITDAETGERLYRTGDMGRYLPDGNIEFLGREDTQVKVGGHRIELGEIEATLEQHPAVRAAVAVATGKDRFNKRLAAFVVLDEELTWQQGADEQRPAGPVTIEDLGHLLESFLQIRLDESPVPKYRYPSAGNLYPVQAYVLIKPDHVEGAEGGVYYYHPRNHSLAEVGDGSAIGPSAVDAADRIAFEQAGFVIFLIAQMDAIVPMYGAISGDFCLLEAGYMGRLLMTTAESDQVRLSTLRTIDSDRIRESLSLGDSHLLLLGFAGGQATGDLRESISLAESEGSAAFSAGGSFAPLQSPWGQKAARPVTASGARIEETLQSSAAMGTLANQIDRLEFKLQDAGLRRLEDGQAQVQLSKPEHDEDLILDYNYRRSDREFLQQAIPFEEFTLLMNHMIHAEIERVGVLNKFNSLPANSYPIQTYVYVKQDRVEGVGGGTYYFNSRDNRLELLSPDVQIENSVHAPANREIAEGSAFALLLVADPNLVMPVFGEWARDLCLLEAGYIGQALMTVTPAQQIGLCPVGSMDFDRIRHLFGLDETQTLLHSFLGGRIPPREQGQRARSSRRRTKSVQDPEQLSSITKDLGAYLGSKLPDYMVPPVITVLDDLPLSSNGKVDRNALAILRADQFEEDVDFVPPRTAPEHSLAAVWRDLLGVEHIAVGDNFFSLGGDSVQAIQFLARARGVGYEIGIQYFFEHPTIAELALGASEIEPEHAESSLADEITARASGLTLEEFPDAELSQDELNELIAQFARDDDQSQKAEDH